MTAILQNSSNGLSAQSYRIFEYIDTHEPTPVRKLLEETNSGTPGINYACRRLDVKYFPPYRTGRNSNSCRYKIRDLVTDELTNRSGRIVYLPGQELRLFEMIKPFIPTPEEIRADQGLRLAMARYIKNSFPPMLIPLIYNYYEFYRNAHGSMARNARSIEPVLQNQLIIQRSPKMMIRNLAEKPYGVVTTEERGCGITRAIANELRVKMIVCNKTEDNEGNREISLRKDAAKELDGKTVILADDTRNTGDTLEKMRKNLKEANAQEIGAFVQAADPRITLMPDSGLEYLCIASLP
jgi:hypothetical protein